MKLELLYYSMISDTDWCKIGRDWYRLVQIDANWCFMVL